MVEKLKNKYVFFDVDGTLSEYRYKEPKHYKEKVKKSKERGK